MNSTLSMGRRSFIALAAAAASTLAACGSTSTESSGSTASEPVELKVFAAASLTESLQKAGDQYAAVNEGTTLSFNFDSSGTLKTQIEQGAACDVFISAGQKQMNQLDATKGSDANPDGLDFIDPDTRFDILENKVTLVVPEDNPKSITSFADMAEKLKAGEILLDMGNSDVPVGQYTQKILAYYGLDEAALAAAGNVTYGTNVKEVTTQVSEGTVDCGVIYATDAHSAGLTIVDEATEEMCGRVVYPAAALKASEHEDEAKQFLEFLKGSEASADFEEVGFTPLAEA